MYRPTRTSAPATTPVSLAEAKEHLSIESTESEWDDLLTRLIEAATAHFDGYSGTLGQCLITQTWRQDFDGVAKTLRLPLLAASVSSVKYTDGDGAENTVTASDYQLLHDDIGSYVRFDDDYSTPSDLAEVKAVAVTYTAGFGDAASDVPQAIRHAILLLVAHWFRNREAAGDAGAPIPMGVDALVAPYRRVGV